MSEFFVNGSMPNFIFGAVKKVNGLLSARVFPCLHFLPSELIDGEPANRFMDLIIKVAKKGPVVILIDEYDRAILDNINDKERAIEIRNELRSFYGVTKTTEPLQRFLFITGVASFAKTSFFSELNHVTQLSRSPKFATMLGYTQEELEEYFADHLTAGAEINNISREEFLEKLKIWYNGYRFHTASPTVYNPVSIAQLLRKSSSSQSRSTPKRKTSPNIKSKMSRLRITLLK
jgi:hypothetical protein